MTTTTLALEGGVCAGKSTIARKLAESGIGALCHEYMDLVDESQAARIASLPPLDRVAFFLNLDIKRIDLKPDGSFHSRLILDRSFYTLFAFEYACARQGLNDNNLAAVDLLDHYTVVLPSQTIFLDVSHETRLSRHEKRDTPVLDIFLEREFNDSIKLFFINLSRRLPIYFIDGEESVENITERLRSSASTQFTPAEDLHSVKEAIRLTMKDG